MAYIKRRTTAGGQARYHVEWRLPDGKVPSQTFTRRRDADDFVTKIEHDRITGFTVDPAGGRLTIDELAERWLTSNPGKRENTIGRDRSALRAHIIPAIGKHQLREVRQADARQLVNVWSKRLAPKTVARTFGTLRAALAYAVNADLIARSPCRNIKLPQARRRDVRTLTPEDVGLLSNAVDERYRVMVWVAALLGLRWGEVAGLRVGRLDMLGRTVTVSEIVTGDAQGRPVAGPPKSLAGLRTLAVPDALVGLLAEHMARLGLTAVDADAYVFPSPGGGPWSYTNFRRRICLPASRAAGLDGVGFHDLRRMAATSLVLGNVDLKTAQTRLGHSDPRLTLAVYAQATTEADRAAAATIGERFSGVTGKLSRDERGIGDSSLRVQRGSHAADLPL